MEIDVFLEKTKSLPDETLVKCTNFTQKATVENPDLAEFFFLNNNGSFEFEESGSSKVVLSDIRENKNIKELTIISETGMSLSPVKSVGYTSGTIILF